MRRILLVEPAGRTKYPPLGLMKISSYHKLRNDYVEFAKGNIPSIRCQQWDRIYISTLFTYTWDAVIRAVEYYKRAVNNPSEIFLGGVMATLLSKELKEETGATVISGLLDEPGQLDTDSSLLVDQLTPDYELIDASNYVYELSDAYIAYATRGCPNRCKFCAVNLLEPSYNHYVPLREQIRAIEDVYGERQNLILLDNNVLASKQFQRIIEDIVALGFAKGAKRQDRLRFVDFNQGLDLRKLTRAKMRSLSKVAIRPMRLALDDIRLKDSYIEKVLLAKEHGVSNLSTYILYNFNDTPADFYDRMRINVELNESHGTMIYGFPMKFVPLHARNRSYIGPHWNWRMLRGVQCILHATRGLVTTNRVFFEAAFGKTVEEFLEITMMPDEYIMFRKSHCLNGAADWRNTYRRLTEKQKSELIMILGRKHAGETNVKGTTKRVSDILEHYN